MKIILARSLVCCLTLFGGCCSVSTYSSHGKAFQTSANINGSFTLTTKVDGSSVLKVNDVPVNVPFEWTAVVDSKGNPILDKDGHAIYNTRAVVAGLSNSEGNSSFWQGLSKFSRSVGSVTGTALAGVAAWATGGAIGTAASSIH